MSNNTPLGTVALCLSGGGYRAAAFHLGTIDMLNELGLLDNVKLLSTVSGGTFTGMSYAMWRIDQPNLAKFDEFYKEFYCFTVNNNIIAEALKLLTKERERNSPKAVSLIRAAADIYHQQVPYSKGKNFGELYDANGKLKAPFKDIIFNSTEFLRGNSFRFRASRSKKVDIGNKFFDIDSESAKHLRLADIAAASSCFPAGFEPLLFPDEFDWKKENSVRLTAQYLNELAAYYFESDKYYAELPENPNAPIPVKPANSGTQTTIVGREIILENYINKLDKYYADLKVYYQNIADNIPNKFKPTKPKNDFINENLTPKCGEDGKPVTIPLMDGGIYDNQGIASIILADETEGNDIDLFIISDTNQRNDEMLPPQPKFNLAEMLGYAETSAVAKLAEKPLAKAAGGIWNKVSWLALAIGGISLIYAVSLAYKIFAFVSNNAFSWANAAQMIFFYFFPFIITLLLIGASCLVFIAKSKFNKFLKKHREIKIKGSNFKLLKFAEKISLNDVGNLVSGRLASLITMSANVFMKAIRGEQYEHINQYDVIDLSRKTPPLNVKTSGRIAYNLIYDLNPTNKRPELWKADVDTIPTEEMKKISIDAETVDTTLWFNKDSGELKNLVICGQITVCLSVMKFLFNQRGTIPNDPNSPYHDLYMRVKERWMKLKQNPEAYYREVNCSKSS
jgi:Patatin-like phospholipase